MDNEKILCAILASTFSFHFSRMEEAKLASTYGIAGCIFSIIGCVFFNSDWFSIAMFVVTLCYGVWNLFVYFLSKTAARSLYRNLKEANFSVKSGTIYGPRHYVEFYQGDNLNDSIFSNTLRVPADW